MQLRITAIQESSSCITLNLFFLKTYDSPTMKLTNHVKDRFLSFFDIKEDKIENPIVSKKRFLFFKVGKVVQKNLF